MNFQTFGNMCLRMTLVYFLIGVAMTTAQTPEGFRGRAKRFVLKAKDDTSVTMGLINMKYPSDKGTPLSNSFPEELKYMLTLEGNTETELHLVRDRSTRIPDTYQQDMTGKFSRKNVIYSQDTAFYRDLNGKGLFACKRQNSSRGQFECGLSAMLNTGEEVCYIGLGASHADCASRNEGQVLYFQEPEVDKSYQATRNNGTSRKKRSILPAQGFKAVEVAYLPDAKFTDLFYRRYGDDTTAAEAEMVTFFTLLTNEINAYYSTLVETSQGSLNIQVYTSTVALPGYRQNYFWSENYNDGTSLFATEGMKNNIEFTINDSSFLTEQFDFVFAITGFNLRDSTNGNPLVSFTFFNTICTTSRNKYAVTEFTSWNLPRVLAHELGHGLGAQHDDDTSCQAGVNLMSQYLFSPDETTKDTYQYFSSCSVADIISHLNSQSPCLDDNAFTYAEFVDSFCQGFLGQQESSADKQCERLTNFVGSTACDAVTEDSCYLRNQIRCRDSEGSCTQKLQYLWNLTPCGTDKVCYKGSCQSTFNICSTTTTTRSTTSSTPTTTSTTSTTSSTTSTSPTTTSTTTSPTTTTSSTTSSTTSTTSPTTSTSTSPSTSTQSTTSATTSTTSQTTSTTTSPTTSTSSTTSSTTSTTSPTTSTTTSPTTSTSSTTSSTTSTTSTTTSTTTSPTTSTSSSTSSMTSTTSPTTSSTTSPTTSTLSTTSSTTSSTSPTTSTTSPTTTSTTTTPTTTEKVPCSCCGFKRNKRRKRCCKTARNKIDAECYCCGSLRRVEEPDGWTGRRF